MSGTDSYPMSANAYGHSSRVKYKPTTVREGYEAEPATSCETRRHFGAVINVAERNGSRIARSKRLGGHMAHSTVHPETRVWFSETVNARSLVYR